MFNYAFYTLYNFTARRYDRLDDTSHRRSTASIANSYSCAADMITNYHQNIFNGNEEEDSKTVKHNIDSIVPPGFEPVKIKGGTKGGGKETTDAKIKM